MTPDNLLSIIEEGRYRSALFTTFSLNIGFFEGYVLPRLHRAYCDDVTILVDERFYAESLGETSSRHVGVAYRLLPVKMSDGVFHAKLTYLWSGSGKDVLTVGSGNLTFAGWGRQLECLHVMRSDEQPQAFRDLAQILHDLTASPHVRLGDAREVVEKFQRHISTLRLAKASTEPAVRLFSSINRSISTAVIEALGKWAPFDEVIVMSPFHDSKARPLISLARALGSEIVKVAVDRDLQTPVESGLEHVKFVRREPADELRKFHAKWYEFRAEINWLMSGSVNATHTSLETTNNFEVASLQQANVESLCRWKSTKPDASGVAPDEITGDADFLIVTASVNSDNQIRGAFLTPLGMDGVWQVSVFIDGNLFKRGTVSVQAGEFVFSGPSELVDTTEPCQVELKRDGQRAVGWLMFPAMLGMSWEQRDFARRVRKLRGPSGEQDDFVSIVAWLAEKVWEITAVAKPTSAASKIDRDEDTEPSNTPFDYGKWLEGGSIHGPTGTSLGMCRMALAALAQFKKSKGKLASRDDVELADFDESNQGVPDHRFQDADPQDDGTDSLAKLGSTLEEILEGDSIGEEDGMFFLEALLWVTLLRNLRDRHLALDGLPFTQWSAFARPLLAKFPDSSSLARLTATAMCCAITFQTAGDPSTDRCSELGQKAMRALGATFDRNVILAELESSPAFSPLSEEQKLQVPDAQLSLRAYQSLGKRLHQYLSNWSTSPRQPVVPGDIADRLGELLAELNKRKQMRPPYIEWTSHLPAACNKCGVSFAADRSELRNRRGMACRGCKRLHFWTGDE